LVAISSTIKAGITVGLTARARYLDCGGRTHLCLQSFASVARFESEPMVGVVRWIVQ